MNSKIISTVFRYKMSFKHIAKISLKRIIPVFILVSVFLFSIVGVTMAESLQKDQTGATIDAYSGSGAAKGVGLWILFTLAVSYGVNNYIRNRENNTQNKKSGNAM